MLRTILSVIAGHWSITAGVCIVVLALLQSSRRQRRRLPPGPTPLPFLGNLSLLKSGDKREVFRQMRQKYGDVFSFFLGTRPIVVVNGYDALKEVFVKRADVFSDRPHMFTVDRVGQGKGIVNTSGKVWKDQRRFALTTLRQFGLGKSSFEDKIQEEITEFLQELDHVTEKVTDPQDMIQTAIANVICSIVFGKRFDYKDQLFKRFLEIFDENMKLVGGSSVLNYFPFLKYIPGDLFKFGKVLENVEFVQTFVRDTVEKHKTEFSDNNVRDFVDAYLKEMQEEEKSQAEDTTFNYDQLIKVIGDLFVGGTETTATTVRWAVIFLVRNQHVQKRMQTEIDQFVGRNRRPTLQDKQNLRYTEAAILEVQRCADIAPFSVPHGVHEDILLRDCLIPKGSVVIPNIHSVLADPLLWQDPDCFKPERFLDETGNVVKPDAFIPFFMGRRVCLGESLARMELFLFLSAMVQRYNIEGAEVLPSLEPEVGLTYTPAPYSVRFVRRI